MDLPELTKFAKRYANAWCSQDPESVAAFFVDRGSISINNGPPAVGRAAIAKEAQAFMTTFPDMVVTMDNERLTQTRSRSALSVSASAPNRCCVEPMLTGRNQNEGK